MDNCNASFIFTTNGKLRVDTLLYVAHSYSNVWCTLIPSPASSFFPDTYCDWIFDGITCWPPTKADSSVEIPCPEMKGGDPSSKLPSYRCFCFGSYHLFSTYRFVQKQWVNTAKNMANGTTKLTPITHLVWPKKYYRWSDSCALSQ